MPLSAPDQSNATSPDDGAASPLALLRKPYLLLIADATDPLVAKTALGLRDWIRGDVIGQWRFSPQALDLGLPDLTPEQAVAAGAGSLVIGAAPVGGQIPAHWGAALIHAARAGLDIVSGLHASLDAIGPLADAAHAAGVALHDVRRAPAVLPIGTGRKRTGKRLLTIGTDCAIGKKYTSLALAAAMRARGIDTDFRATGQTGILIAGSGVAIDTVVADFMSGAAELVSADAPADHWDVIEGQGSLFHPAYAGVSLALLHGSQPDALVLCTDATRTEIDGCPGFPIPPIGEAIRLNEEMARVTNRAARCVGISVNTKGLSDAEAAAMLARIADDHGLPCVDPVRGSVDAIVARIESLDW